ncbi:MAG: hypothetical protein M3N11_03485, partial [Actinomycetota bacterium]|nr:hypothetical protein [Actinomycetota bacterium]
MRAHKGGDDRPRPAAPYHDRIDHSADPSGAPAPSSLVDIAHRVEERVHLLLDAEATRWSAVDPDLRRLIECLTAFVDAGGKRLRPAFCHWAYVGAGGDAGDP